MSEPIVEQIAQWLFTALQGMTPAAGYFYQLKLSRPLTLDVTTDTIEDLSAILETGGIEVLKGTLTHDHRKRYFLLSVFFLGGQEPAIPLDQRMSRVEADVEKLIGAHRKANSGSDKMCGGLAYDLTIEEDNISVDHQRQASVLMIPIGVKYKVLKEDPCAQ